MQTAADFDAAPLWSRYLVTRDERAFATLVLAHIDLVHGTARRLLPDHPHLADDATQTVFCDLARNADQLPPGVNLAGWLHQHTCFTARKLLRGELRRDRREHTAAAMLPTSADEPSTDTLWLGVRPLLDEAMLELEEPDRRALLLRFLQGQPFKAVAGAFGISEDAARMRVTRALDRLRETLERKGVSTTADALGHSLASQAAIAAPVALAGAVTASALSTGSAKAATVVAAGWTLKKLALAGAASAAAVGGLLLIQHQQSTIRTLRDEAITLRPLAEQVRQLEDRSRHLVGLLPQADEVANARKLLEQVSALQAKLAASESALSNALAEAAAARAATNGMVGFVRAKEPVKTFTAQTRKTIAPGQSVLMGGWEINEGKRTYSLVTVEWNENDQVEAVVKFFVGPAAAMDEAGLRQVARADGNGALADVVDTAQALALFKELERKVGIDTLTGPRVTTLDQRGAQMTILDELQIKGDPLGNEGFQTGPSVDLFPMISADRKTIDLQISTSISVPNQTPLPAEP